jgi:hypothetical protein
MTVKCGALGVVGIQDSCGNRGSHMGQSRPQGSGQSSGHILATVGDPCGWSQVTKGARHRKCGRSRSGCMVIWTFPVTITECHRLRIHEEPPRLLLLPAISSLDFLFWWLTWGKKELVEDLAPKTFDHLWAKGRSVPTCHSLRDGVLSPNKVQERGQGITMSTENSDRLDKKENQLYIKINVFWKPDAFPSMTLQGPSFWSECYNGWSAGLQSHAFAYGWWVSVTFPSL